MISAEELNSLSLDVNEDLVLCCFTRRESQSRVFLHAPRSYWQPNRQGEGLSEAHPRNWGMRRRKEASVLYIYPDARLPMHQALMDYVLCVSRFCYDNVYLAAQTSLGSAVHGVIDKHP